MMVNSVEWNPSGFLEREMHELREAAASIGWGDNVSDEDAAKRERIMAAQQALAWALDPLAVRSPYVMIVGAPSHSAQAFAAGQHAHMALPE